MFGQVKMNQNFISTTDSENEISLYKCYFCQQNIDRYEIEEHFATIHKFESFEHICEVCDKAFDTQTNLIKHIENVHNHAKKQPGLVKMTSFEDGKSKFLEFITNNFESENDALKLLDLINENLEELRLLIQENLKNHKDTKNQATDNEATIDDQVHSNIKNNGYENRAEKISTPSNCESEFEEAEIVEKASNDLINQKELLSNNWIDNRMNDQQNTFKVEPKIELEEFPNDFNVSNQHEMDLKSLLDYALESENEIENSDISISNEKFKNYDDEKFLCISCQKSFSCNRTLKRHVTMIHEIKKQHKCDVCDKLFYGLTILNRHLSRNHNGSKDAAKDYQCKFSKCGKSFSDPYQMKQHIKTVHHKDESKHKCDTCGECFSGIRKLKTHFDRIHSNVAKDFQCHICGNDFDYENDLQKHIKRVHADIRVRLVMYPGTRNPA